MLRPEEITVDLFAGGGGTSTGMADALGRAVDEALNHDETAMAVHAANHPNTHHNRADIWRAKPSDVTHGRPVGLLWASPDCRHHSRAKGSAPRSKSVRSLAWAVVRWAREVEPRIIMVENVVEFEEWGPLDQHGVRIAEKKGHTFRSWVAALRRLGYHVEWRRLDASHFGAPTKRIRLFVIARRDGAPIRWPMPTHGRGLLPLRTAAECIDWSIPCPSIFDRKKPLAEKTLWRIAQGIRRFVLESSDPFVIQVSNSGTTGRGAYVWPSSEPVRTVTTSGGGFGVVTPLFATTGNGERAGQDGRARDLRQPHGTITAKGSQGALVAPLLAAVNHGRHEDRSRAVEEPLPTVCAGQRSHAVIAPVIAKFRHDSEGASAAAPLPTITAGGALRPSRPATGNPLGLIAPTLVQMQRENPPQDVAVPLSVITTQGNKHNLVSAFIAKHFGGVVGHEVERPVGAVTGTDHHALAAATLVKMRGECHGADVREPLPTVSAGGGKGGIHVAEVRAFLTAYFGTGVGQDLRRPARTLTTKHRLGLVTIEGTDYQIVDIGMRMLEPEELLRAQFGEYAEGYDLTAAKTKAAKVRLIGNSVCPHVAHALVAANLPRAAEVAA